VGTKNNDSIWTYGLPEWGQLRSVRSNRCLDFPGSVASNGSNALIWGCANIDWQMWVYEKDTKLIRNKYNPTYCLDHGGPDEAVNGGKVQLWQCMNHPNLQWEFDGTYIRNVYNTNLVMDAFGDSDGDNVGQWSFHGGPNQQWRLVQ
jgi:hypothetical protein